MWHKTLAYVLSLYKKIAKKIDDHFKVCLKAKKTHGLNLCVVISVYTLDTPLIEKLQNIVIIDKYISNTRNGTVGPTDVG